MLLGNEKSSRSVDSLTARELEILELITAGYRNSAIAGTLFLEPKTVERHINNIYRKVWDGSEHMHPRVCVATYYASLRQGRVTSGGGGPRRLGRAA
jgi:DNA-binding NarL/FixJ family response regulator